MKELAKLGSKRKYILVFFVAVLVRLMVFSYVAERSQVIFQPDSRMYVSLAEGLLRYGSFCYPDHPEQVDVERLPGYPLFLAFSLWISGGGLLAAVLIQIIMDSLGCVLIFYLGESLWRGAGLLSGLLSAFNMSMVTYSHFILNDSLFLFLFLLLIIGILRFLRDPSLKNSAVLGFGLGLAVLIRPVVVYFPLFLIPFALFRLYLRGNPPFVEALGKSLLVGGMFLLAISPWLVRNHVQYGRFRLTAQGGEHLLQYIVPFTWQYSKGIPFIEGMKQANEAFADKMEKDGVEVEKLNPFEKSDLQTRMAMDYLRNEPKTAILKAWFFGMVKNLFSPAIIDLSYLLRVERPHFFYTEGKTFVERTWNFIRGIKGIFGWAVIAGIVGLLISRVIQVWGLIVLFRQKIWETMFCLLIIGYFLLVSGPVGYAKYRLPFEPILIVLTAISLRDLWGRVRHRHARTRAVT